MSTFTTETYSSRTEILALYLEFTAELDLHNFAERNTLQGRKYHLKRDVPLSYVGDRRQQKAQYKSDAAKHN